MKRIYVKILPLLIGTVLLSANFSARATEECPCSEFMDYMSSGGSQPFYGLNGTVLNMTFNLSSFCGGVTPNFKHKIEFIWTVNGNTVLIDSGVIGNASSNLTHDFQWTGSYSVCVDITYTYIINPDSPEPTYKSCDTTLCFEFQVEGPTYEPCEASVNFMAVGSGNAINLMDQSSTSSQGIIVSRKWLIEGYYQPDEFIYYGKNVRHIVSALQPYSGPVEVCLEIMVLNQLTGECCTDTYCQEVEMEVESGNCTMDPDFSFSCFTDDCIYRFNGSIGASNRNARAWYWDFGDGTTSDERRPYHTYSAPGQYEVCLTIVGYDKFGDDCCHETYCRTLNFDCEGVDLTSSPCDIEPGPEGPESEKMWNGPENSEPMEKSRSSADINAPGMWIAPNPVNEMTRVRFALPGDEADVSLTLVNLSGQVVKTYFEHAQFTSGNHDLKIDCGELSPGSYLVVLKYGEKVSTKTLVVR